MATSHILLTAASGMIFGSAITASGVYSPSVIQSQMSLTNFHMLKSFLAASACSALIVVGVNRSGYAKLTARPDSSYGWFGRYDANIVGGMLLGVGMALTGACPGTVLAQLALGVGSARSVAAGCVLGGVAFVKLGGQMKRTTQSTAAPRDGARQKKQTVQEQTGLSTASTILIYETLCLLMIAAATYLAPHTRQRHWLNPIAGGLLIGIAQATSVLFTRKTLGASSAYADVGAYFWSLIDRTSGPGMSNIVFASGVVAGAKLISQYIPAVSETSPPMGVTAAVVGGFVMVFGARMAGGCTSGHGISGMATMGLSSFVTIASLFAGGIGASFLL
ncbi:uncharacterized protein A1O9_02460 [Exophiala aquamarina CBS 119918]|uniref:Uncharacterized protein n=1 Tax=Exophiala aquamarina CBS 119918 TaxID=1182545 RepID=A0A072PM00_9EURO|nr:uncharacterized protein A1O9_02460 [Exophiala aquamarina CBS 119918]KEF60896.1 hypothetical protein A1O9_02460 [Exophiala aquamarina CBS 119918]